MSVVATGGRSVGLCQRCGLALAAGHQPGRLVENPIAGIVMKPAGGVRYALRDAVEGTLAACDACGEWYAYGYAAWAVADA